MIKGGPSPVWHRPADLHAAFDVRRGELALHSENWHCLPGVRMLQRLLEHFRCDLAVDLGTANTLVGHSRRRACAR